MRLLRLEISGFKSFCDKTTINFVQDGISIVVGPNGCGKSNIVDAIRWTLGEQSAKHLRGSSMEDVIFNGSAVRQPVSLAQVTLVFSNPEHDTVHKYAEFSEISITRRLYRSGESQYLINKTPCRLTDIRELFMDTGIGGKGYSIIEQGKIDQIITSRAEDRRTIIDEAAGIVKFKAKRKEAERKFAATKQNLLRVEDILAELERQEGTLKGQVAKAEEYLEAKARLERLQQCTAVTLWHRLKKRSDSISDSRENNIEQQKDRETVVATLEADEATHNLDTARKKAEREDLQLALQKQKEEIIKLESRLETDNQAIENLDEWQQKGKEESDLLEKQIKTVEYQITSHHKNAEDFQADINQKTALLDQLQEREKVSERELSDQRLELKKTQEEEIETITRLTGDRNQLTQLRERLNETSEKKEQLESRVLEIEDEEEKIRQAEYRFSSELKLKRKRKDRIQATIETYQHRKNEVEGEIERLNRKMQEIDRERSQAENRLDSLQEFMKSHEEYDAGTRKFLEFLDADPNLADELGFLGTLAELVTPPDTTLPQTTAFLNRYFNLLVFTSLKHLEEIVSTIDDLEAEQLQLYFLDLIPEYPDRGITPLADWIQSKPDLSIPVPLADSFESIDLPIYQLSRSQLREAGGLIDPLASIMTQTKIFLIGKPEKTSQAELFFQRRTELVALEETLEKTTSELREFEKNLEDESQVLDEVKRASASAEKEVVDLNLEAVGLEKEVDAKSLERQRLTNAKQGLVQDREQIETSHTQFTEKIDGLTRSIEADHQRHQAVQKSLAELSARIDETVSSKQEHSDELQHLRITLAGLEEKRRNNASTLERLSGDKQQRMEQLEEIRSRTQETRDKRHELNSNIEKTRNGLPRRLEDLSETEKKLNNLSDEIEIDLLQLSDIQKSIRNEQKEITGLREKNHKLDVKLAQLVQEAKNIEDNLFLEHSLKPEDLLQTFDVKRFDVNKESETIDRLKQSIGGMDDINLAAKKEYDVLKERLDFLTTQSSDLNKSIEALEDSINKINRESRRRFRDTFKLVNQEFSRLFPLLFGGGEAYLELTDESDLLESGVEIIAKPPGKKLQNMTLLSGGEKALTAIALVFAVFQIKPSPFCLLDEVDAPLDDANNVRFNQHVKIMTEHSQFIIITHNKKTMEVGDVLFGVTMEEPGISKIVSVDFHKVSDDYLQKAV
ncbi:MAG: AAA family ATPase [Proteobacteria bacterium]|nr:AAA family ATPase [Pseudomonadota bacterium]